MTAKGGSDEQKWEVPTIHSILRSRTLQNKVTCVHIQCNRDFKYPYMATMY